MRFDEMVAAVRDADQAMKRAVRDADQTMRRADKYASMMAEMLVGRLRKVKSDAWNDDLAKLKRELRDYNISTREWKP